MVNPSFFHDNDPNSNLLFCTVSNGPIIMRLSFLCNVSNFAAIFKHYYTHVQSTQS